MTALVLRVLAAEDRRSSQSGTEVAIRQPAPTEPTASRISGIVMIGGDSCGCSMSSVHRFGPWKVSTNSRVM